MRAAQAKRLAKRSVSGLQVIGRDPACVAVRRSAGRPQVGGHTQPIGARGRVR